MQDNSGAAMTKPLTKEQRARMREWLATVKSVISIIVGEYMQELLDSHDLADEALALATAKLATARVCEKCGGSYKDIHMPGYTHYETDAGEPCPKYHYGRCPHCTNGVVFSDERARELLNRLDLAETARDYWKGEHDELLSDARLILKRSDRVERWEHQERGDYNMERFDKEFRDHLYSERGREILQANTGDVEIDSARTKEG